MTVTSPAGAGAPRIDLTVDPAGRRSAVRRAAERGIVIPTFRQQMGETAPPRPIAERLRRLGLWDVDPANLFRITWHNEPVEMGGGFGPVNTLELPPELTGVPARIIALVGKWFPTGAHKVGAAFGCLVPRLVTGQFDPARQKAVWPSTGNYCRGGAYDSALLGCESIAILPEGMSRERFEWLSGIAGEVIKTPGSESNVKEIFDKCWELRRSGADLMIFNQFEELGNYLWHYAVTGSAMQEVVRHALGARDEFRGVVLTTGSAGTIACGDRLKTLFPGSVIAAAEALQCPTLLAAGHGAHRIEGIGDKHVPWIHNVRNTDVVIGIDDRAALDLIRLFNEPAGRAELARRGVAHSVIAGLPLAGISGAANLLGCIKLARSLDLGPHDVLLTVLTDSIDLYRSRLTELTASDGPFTERHAVAAVHEHILGANTADLEELTLRGRRRIHNLKYFTWVEQQGRQVEELDAQWSDPRYWTDIPACLDEIDALIDEFNAETGVLARL